MTTETWGWATQAMLMFESDKVPQWYERVTGVIAIPAAIVAMAYSYLLIQKTRLESRKLEIEIAGKVEQAQSRDKQVTDEPATASGERFETVAETLTNRRYSILILRYIVLELGLRVYNGITSPIQMLSQLALSGIYLVAGGRGVSGTVSMIVAGTQTLSSTVISIGYWLIFAALGWPLFKDVNAMLGIDLRDYSPRRLIRELRKLRK